MSFVLPLKAIKDSKDKMFFKEDILKVNNKSFNSNKKILIFKFNIFYYNIGRSSWKGNNKFLLGWRKRGLIKPVLRII